MKRGQVACQKKMGVKEKLHYWKEVSSEETQNSYNAAVKSCN